MVIICDVNVTKNNFTHSHTSKPKSVKNTQVNVSLLDFINVNWKTEEK